VGCRQKSRKNKQFERERAEREQEALITVRSCPVCSRSISPRVNTRRLNVNWLFNIKGWLHGGSSRDWSTIVEGWRFEHFTNCNGVAKPLSVSKSILEVASLCDACALCEQGRSLRAIHKLRALGDRWEVGAGRNIAGWNTLGTDGLALPIVDSWEFWQWVTERSVADS